MKITVYENKLKQIGSPKIKPELKKSKKEIIKDLKVLIEEAVIDKIKNKKIGLLFSGGVDSSLIAFILKKNKIKFTCYTSAIDNPRFSKSKDLIYAQKVAQELNLKLKVNKIKMKDVEKYLKKTIEVIESPNVVKVGVGATIFSACELAKKDKVEIIFSGLGSEEIFAGYERHVKAKNINKECLNGLENIYERDILRDEAIINYFNFELRVPFLERKLVEYALKIPGKYKINERIKAILRDVALDFGLKEEFAERKKVAAQYGSKFDRAIQKLSKKQGLKKSEYLAKFFKLGALYSSGKDSSYALYKMQERGFEVACLMTMVSKNKDSYMFHTPNIDLVDLQSEAMEIPLIKEETEGEKEKELKDLEKLISLAKKRYGTKGIITGALYSTYQKNRIEKICKKLKLKCFSPLWHMDQEEEMREIISKKFEFVFGSVAAEGLDKAWLNKRITNKDIDNLVKLNKKIGLNIAGEGGEFESLVLDAPMFKKKLIINKFKIVEESKYVARLIIENATLKKK